MTRTAALVLGVVLVALLIALSLGSLFLPERVYSADEVLAGLQRDPAHWMGRTVLVRGWLISAGSGCSGCAPTWATIPCRAGSVCLSARWEELMTPPADLMGPGKHAPLFKGFGRALFLRWSNRSQPGENPFVMALFLLSQVPVIGPVFAGTAPQNTYRIKLFVHKPCPPSAPSPGPILPCTPDGVRV